MEVMRNDEEGHMESVLQVMEEGVDRILAYYIHIFCRLVKEKNLGFIKNRPSKKHFLQLAA